MPSKAVTVYTTPAPTRSDVQLWNVQSKIELIKNTPMGVFTEESPNFKTYYTRAHKHILATIESKIQQIRTARTKEAAAVHANIIAVVPTFETEPDIDLAIEFLLKQTRQIDTIVIVINGPGNSNVAYEKALPYAQNFSNVILENPQGLTGKVNTLNWAYMKYAHFGNYDFWLGVDADVECDVEMVAHLEEDLIKRPNAACKMARYSFRVPENMKNKSRSLVYGQRHEFAMTGIRHQLRKDTSDIAGGQATLFRVSVLREATKQTYGGVPWDVRSKVEDAELTRTMQKLGYTIGVSRSARAWTGLMYTAHSWQKQRRKWQSGHLEDMLRDFHPILDRRRWVQQCAMGWNVLIRILFATLLATSLSLHQFEFSLIWVTPICLAILQSLLIASKIPDKRFGELVRAILFVPGEIYYLRTLSVWVESVVLAFLNIKRDGWGNQIKAEASTKRTAVSGWIILTLAVSIPVAFTSVVVQSLPVVAVRSTLGSLWWALTALTIGSSVGMLYTIIRVLRNYRSVAP